MTTTGGEAGKSTFAEVMKVDVPAGSYAVSASLYGIPDSVAGDELRSLLCQVGSGSEFIRATTTEEAVHAIIALDDVVTLASPGSITVDCLSEGTAAQPFSLFGHSLVAVQVGNVTTTP